MGNRNRGPISVPLFLFEESTKIRPISVDFLCPRDPRRKKGDDDMGGLASSNSSFK